MTNPHILSAFETELTNLNANLVAMGKVVATQLERALEALRGKDVALADRVIAEDSAVDAAQAGVDEAVIAVLVLRHPVADDLRLVMSTSKIAEQLERIGDLAANIAKRVKAIGPASDAPLADEASELGRIASGILADALAAFADRDAGRAERAREHDLALDQLHTRFFHQVTTHMAAVPADVALGAHLLFIGKNIERIGDHATNIGELALYLVTGHAPQEERVKGDLSSVTSIADQG